MMKNNDFEIYIHIPFCLKKCSYCDFNSFTADEAFRMKYIDSLERELICRKDELKGMVSSVFLGGGTPGILSSSCTEHIIKVLRENYDIKKDAEITIETNPCTVTEEKLHTYLENGINRISLGAQSIYDHHLKILGRAHDFKQLDHSYSLIKSAGFKNINMDLMFGLPSQSLCEWIETLEYAGSLDITHISAYSLMIEEGTHLFDIKDELAFPDEDLLSDMFFATADILSEYGYDRYEISNYSRPGYECMHNIGYWTGKRYIGAGLSASSFDGSCRFKNTDNFSFYISNSRNCNNIREDAVSVVDELEKEFIILQLRLTKGFSAAEFKNRFGKEAVDVFGEVIYRLSADGLLEKKGDYFRIPDKYLFVSNRIMSEFI